MSRMNGKKTHTHTHTRTQQKTDTSHLLCRLLVTRFVERCSHSTPYELSASEKTSLVLARILLRGFLQEYGSKQISMSALTAKVELWLPITTVERATGGQHSLSTFFLLCFAVPQILVLIRRNPHGAPGQQPLLEKRLLINELGH